MSLKDHDNESDTGVSEVHMTFKDEVRMSLKDAVHTSFRRLPLPAFNSPSRVAVKGFFFKMAAHPQFALTKLVLRSQLFGLPVFPGEFRDTLMTRRWTQRNKLVRNAES